MECSKRQNFKKCETIHGRKFKKREMKYQRRNTNVTYEELNEKLVDLVIIILKTIIEKKNKMCL